MPFSQPTKARMFVRSARICSLCFKQCGAKIEAAHIIAESDGGSNDDDNGMPLCFDCHQEIGSYNPKHPKGNKYTPAELKARRDQLYALVEAGTLQALIVAEQLHARVSSSLRSHGAREVAEEVGSPYKPSKEAEVVLRQAKEQFGGEEALPSKLLLLSARDRAFVLDSLTELYNEELALKALIAIAENGLGQEDARLLMEQVIRRVALAGTIDAKATIMRHTSVDLLSQIDEGMRVAFYRDVIDAMLRDQYVEVNKITPAVVLTHAALPPELGEAYMKALFSQAESGAYSGGPAAKRALATLPNELAKAGLAVVSRADLLHVPEAEGGFMRAFIERYRDLWPSSKAEVFQDYISCDYKTFVERHWNS